MDSMGPDMNDLNVQIQLKKKQYMLQKAKEKNRNGKSKTNRVVQDNGLPMGQTLAPRWLVLDMRPTNFSFSMTNWTLEIRHNSIIKRITMQDIINHPSVECIHMDFHCVTSWSCLGLQLKGLRLLSLLNTALGLQESDKSWNKMVQYGADMYTTTLPRSALYEHDAYLVFDYEPKDGQIDPTQSQPSLPMEHGCVRIMFPDLYGYKSCKWLVRLDLVNDVDDSVHGFWERIGYHHVGEVSPENRFENFTDNRVNIAQIVQSPLNGWLSWYAVNFPENFLVGQQILGFRWNYLLRWRFYWLVISFWICMPLYFLYHGMLYMSNTFRSASSLENNHILGKLKKS